jgi:hypothetical protein
MVAMAALIATPDSQILSATVSADMELRAASCAGAANQIATRRWAPTCPIRVRLFPLPEPRQLQAHLRGQTPQP